MTGRRFGETEGGRPAKAGKVPHPSRQEPGVIYSQGVFGKRAYEQARAIEVAGVRFEKAVTCKLTRTFHGSPCSDWKCSACGKIHNAPRANERCPRCGAVAVEVEL